jgi:hypothetical protein
VKKCATTCLLFNGLPKTKATIITTPTKPNSIVKVYFIKSIESDNRSRFIFRLNDFLISSGRAIISQVGNVQVDLNLKGEK